MTPDQFLAEVLRQLADQTQLIVGTILGGVGVGLTQLFTHLSMTRREKKAHKRQLERDQQTWERQGQREAENHQREQIVAKKQYLRDQLNKVVESMIEDDRWTDEYRRVMCFASGEVQTPEPFGRVRVLCELHFPQLDEMSRPLLIARGQYTSAALRVRKARIQLVLDGAAADLAHATSPKELLTDTVEKYRPYREATNAFLAAARRLAAELV